MDKKWPDDASDCEKCQEPSVILCDGVLICLNCNRQLGMVVSRAMADKRKAIVGTGLNMLSCIGLILAALGTIGVLAAHGTAALQILGIGAVLFTGAELVKLWSRLDKDLRQW